MSLHNPGLGCPRASVTAQLSVFIVVLSFSLDSFLIAPELRKATSETPTPPQLRVESSGQT